jgi:hypothetical protein
MTTSPHSQAKITDDEITLLFQSKDEGKSFQDALVRLRATPYSQEETDELRAYWKLDSTFNREKSLIHPRKELLGTILARADHVQLGTMNEHSSMPHHHVKHVTIVLPRIRTIVGFATLLLILAIGTTSFDMTAKTPSPSSQSIPPPSSLALQKVDDTNMRTPIVSASPLRMMNAERVVSTSTVGTETITELSATPTSPVLSIPPKKDVVDDHPICREGQVLCIAKAIYEFFKFLL